MRIIRSETNKRKLLMRVLASSAAVMLMLTGCAGSSSGSSVTSSGSQDGLGPDGSSDSLTPESCVTVDNELPDEIVRYIEGDGGEYSLDAARLSLYRLGNTCRLKSAIEKARSGEKTVIAYIGGSITEGVGAPNKDTCYAKLSCDWFSSTYGENVEYINAGLSGTSSTLGIVRADKDVFSKSPDVVFIEFAVNDATDGHAKNAYESLVRAALECESKPAVVLITNRLENGYSAQENMKLIGEYYDLTVISPADALTSELDSGRLTWKDYSDDSSHPNKYGHRMISGFIAYMFAHADLSEMPESYTVPQTAVAGAAYTKRITLAPSQSKVGEAEVTSLGSFAADGQGTFGFTESWHSEGGSEPLKITAETNSFIIAYKRNKNGTTGSFDITIDGAPFKTVDTNQSGGWGEAYAEIIINSDFASKHEIEITPHDDGLPVDILAVCCAVQ